MTRHRRLNHSKARSPSDRSGVVLIVILVLVVLLSLAAYSFLLSMQTENLAAKSSGDQLIAQQFVDSGIEWVSGFLELPPSEQQALTKEQSSLKLFAIPMEDDDQSDPQKKPTAQCLVVQRLPEITSELDELPLGLVNESAKLNLRLLLEWETFQPGAGREALLKLPGMTGADADAILDWLDADSVPREEGAEAEYYAQLTTPYRPRNGVPLELEELLLVRGIDSFRLLGKVDPNPSEAITQTRSEEVLTSEMTKPWSEYLTVWSAERNIAQDGSPRIDVNSPFLDELHRQLSEALSPEWANYIVLYRQASTLSAGTLAQPANVEQVTPDFAMPSLRQIPSLLDLIDVSLTLMKDGRTVTIPSPLTNNLETLRSQLPLLFDRLSMHPGPRIEGRININRAPREVLTMIPGIDQTIAERIVAARGEDASISEEHSHPMWLFTEGILDLPTMRRVLPSITVGGDVYRAEFWGIQHERAPMVRYEVVLDACERPVRTLSRRGLEPISRAELAFWVFDAR